MIYYQWNLYVKARLQYITLFKNLNVSKPLIYLFKPALGIYLILASTLALAQSHEVIVLIDTSGSMVETDPQNLRRPAVRLLSQMLPQETQASIAVFDSKAQSLLPFSTVDAQWKDKASQQSLNIHSKGQRTNIEAGLKYALNSFSKDAKSQSIVLLTDGKIDVSKDSSQNMQSRETILNTLLPQLQQRSIQVHTIGLSQAVDKDLLQRLALGSNGMSAIAENADDLMKLFIRAFDQSIATDRVPLNDNTFSVDQSVKEFTVLVFRGAENKPSELITPSKKVLSANNVMNSRWFSDKQYELITVSEPEAGQWQLVADTDPNNRVTVVSNLQLEVEGLPNNILKGQLVDLTFSLRDDNGVITNPALLSLLDINFKQDILGATPQSLTAAVTSHSNDKVLTPQDGLFHAKLAKTLSPGEHIFTVTVDGKTFQRQESKRARVFAQALEALVSQTTSNNGEAEYLLTLVPIQGLTDPKSLDITAKVKLPSEKMVPLDLTQTEYGSWSTPVPASEGQAEYKVFVQVAGKSQTGQSFSVTQGPISVDYNQPLAQPMEPAGDLFDSLNDTGNAQEQAAFKESLPESKPQPEPMAAKPAAAVTPVPSAEVKAPEPISEETPAVVAEPTATSWFNGKNMLIAAIVVGNLLLLVGGIFLYRKIMRKAQAQSDEEDRELLASVESAQQKVKQIDMPKPAPAAETQAEDLSAEADKISNMLEDMDSKNHNQDDQASS